MRLIVARTRLGDEVGACRLLEQLAALVPRGDVG
jgi:hypothetical protein